MAFYTRLSNRMLNYQSDSPDAVLRALSDSARRTILSMLAVDATPEKELAASFDTSLPAVSGYLNVLERAGLVRRGKVGRVGHCRLDAALLEAAAVWQETYKVFWEARLDALDQYLDNQSRGDEA